MSKMEKYFEENDVYQRYYPDRIGIPYYILCAGREEDDDDDMLECMAIDDFQVQNTIIKYFIDTEFDEQYISLYFKDGGDSCEFLHTFDLYKMREDMGLNKKKKVVKQTITFDSDSDTDDEE